MTEPRTEAGLALLVDLDAVGALDGATGDNRPYVTTSILAIEAEAARQALDEVAERVGKLPLYQNAEAGVTTTETTTKRLRDFRAAVLALLSTKEEGS